MSEEEARLHSQNHSHQSQQSGHHHGHDHLHAHTAHHAPRMIIQAILITAIFTVIEFVGGWFSNSLALISDGAHMLTDMGALFLSLFASWVARKPKTLAMSFGYHRAEILGALFSGLMIWLIAGVLIYEAVIRMESPPEVKGPMVFVIASLGLGANLLSMKILHSSKDENLNIKGAYLHLLSDALGSVAAIIAGVVLWLTDWRPIDPIVTIIFSFLMLFGSWNLVKEAVGILMESTPSHLDASEIKTELQKIPGVQEVHDLHIWMVASGKTALSVHLVAETSENVLNVAHRSLKEKFGILHTTIQIENPERFKSEQCYDCTPAGHSAS